ncbi:hypothetical protein L208DRAFT_1309833 [Tricholoma matsutake]|nr:hypothetical protein L208DRAFT_1309833 [Tricholoma matsutake 945]
MVVEDHDEPFYVSSNAVSGSSSPVEYGSEDEEELDKYQSHLLKCAEELQQAASILKAQAKHHNHTWMKSIVDQDIGHDASDLVKDVQHFEKTSRQMQATWPKNCQDAHRVKNTMGYVVNVL